MPSSYEVERLRRLAVLYLSMAHRSDDFSDVELEIVTRRLHDRSEGRDRAAVQSIVLGELARFTGPEDVDATVHRAAHDLRQDLSEEQKEAILGDLLDIAQADGVVLKHESRMLRTLAEIWGVPLSEGRRARSHERWGVLHDLAYVYFVLAHSTDNDLSEPEMQVMLNKLREWHPEAPSDDVRRMLALAMDEYAHGEDAERLEAAIVSVREALPRAQRMAALDDLVKIANADGVFLDDEEDLINRLQEEWDVDPYANYSPQGDKSVDG